jgi:glycosyltransferase involved in cell wall biosynthesis
MRPFYYYDLWRYRTTVDHLFLPSVQMARAMPFESGKSISALPPGAFYPTMLLDKVAPSDSLELLYVGGVLPPVYDLDPMFSYTDTKAIKLTLCCRKAEWEKASTRYKINPNITIVHATGDALFPLYTQAQVFLILWKVNPYLDFAIPVKIFEAMSYGLPIIISSGTMAAEFVQKENMGWVVNSKEEFHSLVSHLIQNPELLKAKQKEVLELRHKHSWQARAMQVARTLMPQ